MLKQPNRRQLDTVQKMANIIARSYSTRLSIFLLESSLLQNTFFICWLLRISVITTVPLQNNPAQMPPAGLV